MRSPEAFRTLVAALDYPMFVVTTAAGGHRSGCLVGFTTQCSISPPRFLVCISVQNHTHAVAAEATLLVVHAVTRDQEDLARLFGGETGDEVDKFTRCSWTEGPGGVPVLSDAPAWFAGEILERLPLGDHTGFLLRPVDGACPGELRSLAGFQDHRDLEPGHEA